jgi:hypothetical protein
MDLDQDAPILCLGKFDQSGIPLTSARAWSQQATVTFQALSLTPLITQLMRNEPLQGMAVYHESGFRVSLTPSPEGFVACLDSGSGPDLTM